MKRYKAIIIGAGFSGLCMGIKLKEAGIQDFVILEKADSLGGTWRENTYPGAECDIPSALYSYSFEHNQDWQYKWSGQAQILKYQQDTSEKYQLTEHFIFGQEVTAASFNDDGHEWTISCADGQQYQAQYFITAVGQLHIPVTPKFPGLEDYQGQHFHSAQWQHDVDLTGKRVAVIGNAASAVQFIPEIVESVAKLTIFQRSPNWILPKVDRPYTAWEQRLSRRVPWMAKVNRFSVWMLGEWGVFPALRGNRVHRWVVRMMCRYNLRKSIKDPAQRELLTPNYPVGAKRILFSDNYYPTLGRANVALVSDAIESFTATGIKANGRPDEDYDVVIFATGFQTNPFLKSIEVSGKAGQSLRERWRDGAEAYLGISTHGFPNMMMIYGPNTNLGHSSIILMIETQVAYIIDCIKGVQSRQASSVEVKQEVEQAYNEMLQRRLAGLVFNEIEASWYKDGDKITNNWAGGTREYTRRLKTIDWSAFETQSRSSV